jgi:hypothetical protein
MVEGLVNLQGSSITLRHFDLDVFKINILGVDQAGDFGAGGSVIGKFLCALKNGPCVELKRGMDIRVFRASFGRRLLA